MVKSLFDTAKKVSKTTKSSDKISVTPPNKKDEIEIEQMFEEFVGLKTKLDSITAQLNLLKGNLTPIGMKFFLELYEKNGGFPKSFNIIAGERSAMFVPTDKYPVLSEEQYDYFMNKYGSECVEKNNEFILDPIIVNKYGKEISEAIIKSKKIPDDVKHKIITVKESFSIRKGVIEKGLTIGRGLNKKISLEEFINEIKPVCYFKEPTLVNK